MDTTWGVVVSAASGLVGALIGGAASLLATRMSNRHALELRVLDRLDAEVAALINTAGELLPSVMLGAPDERLVRRLEVQYIAVMGRAGAVSMHLVGLVQELSQGAIQLLGDPSATREQQARGLAALRMLGTLWIADPKGFEKEQRPASWYRADSDEEPTADDAVDE